ncbi:MAG: plasmid stabilization protein [Deltaproteobacteria bacterium RIFOXYD12_FULL_57_12]|nr:MAG: plasmid stabilization protein [Deltaproteobacteria bacterium RIFOXYD12_FULL_57_12]
MRVEFLESAEAELVDAVAFYNNESEGLGFEFAAEVNRTITRILEYPTAWTALSKRTRRSRTNRFPYGILYQIRGDMILIVAVMHLRRNPSSWRRRLPPGER